MNTLRTLVAEARWRGLWGTVRAIKMHRLGSKPYFVAEDEAGNRFFSNPSLPAGRDRWVEYAEAKNFDAVKIAPEWYVGLRRATCVPFVCRVAVVGWRARGAGVGQGWGRWSPTRARVAVWRAADRRRGLATGEGLGWWGRLASWQ